MRHARELTGAEGTGLDLLVRHLWLPLVESGRGRVVLLGRPVRGGPAPAPDGWHDAQTFSVLPTSTRPRLIVSRAGGPAAARALLAHRGLRPPVARAGRVAAAVLSTAVPARHTLTVQVRAPEDAPRLDPVTGMAQVLGTPVLAVLGIRDGANGKATIQLFDPAGGPLGYAKVAWNGLTADYVRTEVEALRSVRPAAPDVRVPRVLAEGSLPADRHFLVTQPLPPGSRRLGSDDLPLSTLAGLLRVVRRDRAARTGHLAGVRRRLDEAHRRGLPDGELRAATTDLMALVDATTVELPVWERWHGDLVPWNAARDEAGSIWLWDWESGAPDAVAGLDVLHWVLNTLPGRAEGDEAVRLRTAVQASVLPLQAAGLGPRERDTVAAVYALTLAERHWTLAASHGTWTRNRVGRRTVLDLLAVGRDLLGGPDRGTRT